MRGSPGGRFDLAGQGESPFDDEALEVGERFRGGGLWRRPARGKAPLSPSRLKVPGNFGAPGGPPGRGVATILGGWDSLFGPPSGSSPGSRGTEAGHFPDVLDPPTGGVGCEPFADEILSGPLDHAGAGRLAPLRTRRVVRSPLAALQAIQHPARARAVARRPGREQLADPSPDPRRSRRPAAIPARGPRGRSPRASPRRRATSPRHPGMSGRGRCPAPAASAERRCRVMVGSSGRSGTAGVVLC